MTETLIPTSAEEYAALTTKLVTVPSGAVFRIKAMGAYSMSKLISILPEGGLSGDNVIRDFMLSNLEALNKDVISPNVLEPKIDPKMLAFNDALELFVEELRISGLSEEDQEEIEGFREEPLGDSN